MFLEWVVSLLALIETKMFRSVVRLSTVCSIKKASPSLIRKRVIISETFVTALHVEQNCKINIEMKLAWLSGL